MSSGVYGVPIVSPTLPENRPCKFCMACRKVFGGGKFYFFSNFIFFNGRFIFGNDYVRMYVTLVDSSWVVVASVLTGVDFIPLKFADYRVALHSG